MESGFTSIEGFAIAATIAFFGYLIVSVFFGGLEMLDAGEIADTDGADDAGGSGWSILQFLSVQTILLAAMSFSWSWIFWTHKEFSTIPAIVATLITGGAMVIGFKLALKSMSKLSSKPGIASYVPKEGDEGTVYLPVKGKGIQGGQATFKDPRLGSVVKPVMTDHDQSFDVGEVVVIERVSGDSIYIAPLSNKWQQ